MKKINRLAKNEDFRNVINRHQAFSNSSFVLSYLKNDLGYGRVGVTISGKYGDAVERNKAKRQTRMLVAKLFNLTQPYDWVVLIKKGFKNKTYSENEVELTYLHKKFVEKGM
ncbi:MAG: ribonuclease P protein component [Bacilli bacterium]